MDQKVLPPAPTVSLVLGSGGARGLAHVGVIQVLQEQGFDIRAVAGTSMGALVGGVYAAGKLDAYREWSGALQKRDVLGLLDWTISGGGFIKGERIIGALRELVGERDIENLPISYTAVATDLDKRREVWLTRGSLFDAIRASISIPSIFRPHSYQGRLLVDGGLLNPLPITAALREFADVTIAVSLLGPEEQLTPLIDPAPPVTPSGYRKKIADFLDNLRTPKVEVVPEPGLLDLTLRALEVMEETITRLKLAAHPPDLLITIPRNASAFYEFWRGEELIALGRARAQAALAAWRGNPLPIDAATTAAERLLE